MTLKIQDGGASMSGTEKHELSFDTFKIVVLVDEDDNVAVDFYEPIEQGLLLSMSWDDLREVLDFVGIHGLKMHQPYVVEYEDTREAIEAPA